MRRDGGKPLLPKGDGALFVAGLGLACACGSVGRLGLRGERLHTSCMRFKSYGLCSGHFFAALVRVLLCLQGRIGWTKGTTAAYLKHKVRAACAYIY